MSARLGTEELSVSVPTVLLHRVTTADEHGSVLVAADDPELRPQISGPLADHGLWVVEAADAEEALELTRSFSLDVAVVDANALGLDGLELLGRSQEGSLEEYVPMVLVTAATPDDVGAAIHLGAHDCLRPPVRAVDVLDRVHSALGAKRRHDAFRRRMTELQQLVLTDPLTGLYNRRHIKAELAALASAARRRGTPLGVLVVDVDRFKRINDRYGHEAGDIALRSVAHRIRSVVRTEDVVGRWGGDEFVVLLPSTDREAALALGRRLCGAVAQAAATDLPEPVTVSVGCAAGHDPDESSLIGAADAALRRAKAGGRKRVSI